jgi:hypothetical protein
MTPPNQNLFLFFLLPLVSLGDHDQKERGQNAYGGWFEIGSLRALKLHGPLLTSPKNVKSESLNSSPEAQKKNFTTFWYSNLGRKIPFF